MARQTKREVICDKCYSCQFDCVQVQPIEFCENYKKGYTRKEYIEFIHEQNIDLKKLCDKNNLSYNIMLKMLDGRIHMIYKYRVVLNSRIFEKEEYLPYVAKFESGFAYE